MDKKVIFLIAGLLVLGAGLFVVLGSDEEEPAASTEQSTQVEEVQPEVEQNAEVEESTETAAVTITYTDDGFSPEDQSIAVGQTVKFVNDSSVSMWVASDDHPSHTKLPEFDNKQGIGPGESYEFTFEQAGDWDYHDHLNDSEGGTITVSAQ